MSANQSRSERRASSTSGSRRPAAKAHRHIYGSLATADGRSGRRTAVQQGRGGIALASGTVALSPHALRRERRF
jgi:hypothetical protein